MPTAKETQRQASGKVFALNLVPEYDPPPQEGRRGLWHVGQGRAIESGTYGCPPPAVTSCWYSRANDWS
jgi:hypothetical protein